MEHQTKTFNDALHPAYRLWVIDYDIEAEHFVDSLILKLRSEKDPATTRLWASILSLYYVREITKNHVTDAKIKSHILKQGEFSIISTDSQKLLPEINKSLKNLEEHDLNSDDEESDKLILAETLRIAAYLIRVPMVVSTIHKILDMVKQFIVQKRHSAIPSFFLLEDIHQKFNDPAYKGIISHLDNEFWEFFASLAFKVMSSFMYEGTMEYILYYELPPGGHNDIHIKRCEKLMDLSILACKMVADALPNVHQQLDRQILKLCADVLDKSDPQPLINLSYRLLDFSSEDFYMTLPKDQINQFIFQSIDRLNP